MQVDLGPALSSVASPGVSRASLDRLDRRVATAHERIQRGRDDHDHGYAALSVPEVTDTERIHSAVEPLVDVDTLLLVGIGGSALGAATLAAALDADARIRVLDNVDPARTRAVLDDVTLAETGVVVVSRSGTTAETLANFLVARGAFEDAGVDWTRRTLVVTGEAGPLRDLARANDLASLPVPEGIPGRFGVLSTVGLAPAAAMGIDVDAVLAGARAVELSGSLFDCPPYAYGAACYALAVRGARVNAVVPYAESLETFAEWFAQLWAESLGKDGLGQVPARALGATDQHSQLQLYRDGPRNTVVTFVRPRERPDLAIPPTDLEGLTYLGGTDMGAVIDAEYAATAASLTAAGRPAVRVEIERVDAHSIGKLLYGMEAACVLAGELFGVNAFDQPAVEWGKRAARGLLGGGDFDEADSVRDAPSLWIE